MTQRDRNEYSDTILGVLNGLDTADALSVLASVYDDMACIALCEAREQGTTNLTRNAMREQLEYLIANNCKLDYNELKNNIQ